MAVASCMKLLRKKRCRHCGSLYRPDSRNHKKQRYCSKPGCRKASKAESQRKWVQSGVNTLGNLPLGLSPFLAGSGKRYFGKGSQSKFLFQAPKRSGFLYISLDTAGQQKRKSPDFSRLLGRYWTVSEYAMVPKAGIEPARVLTHYPLKIACLPVPPLRQ